MPARPATRLSIRWGLALTVAISLALLAPFSAAAEDDFERPGVYFGLSGIYTHNFFDDQIDDVLSDLVGTSVNVTIDDSAGLNARLGYRAASWFAAELQYEWVDAFDVKAKATGFPSRRVFDIEGHTLTLNTKWIAPIGRTQPYLLLGAGYSRYESNVNSSIGSIGSLLPDDGGKEGGFAGRVGTGIDLYVTSHIVVNAEVSALFTTQDFSKPDQGSIDELWYLSAGAGLQYRF